LDLAPQLLVATACAVTVAITTLPLLSVIAILLGTRRASRGLWYAGGYAVGLGVVFALSSWGLSFVFVPPWRDPSAYLAVTVGVILIVAAAVWWLYDRRQSERTRESGHRFANWLGGLGPFTCAVVGFQFAFHPKNLALTIAAASRTGDLGWAGATIVGVWFCVLGVSSVMIPTVVFARSGPRAEERLRGIDTWVRERGTGITIIVLLVVGVALIAIGAAQLLG